jgi:protein SCO1/2
MLSHSPPWVIRRLVVVLCCVLTACTAPAGNLRWPRSASLFDRHERWQDEHGRSVEFASLRGQPLILTMFYRSCQTRCPLTLAKMQSVYRSLSARGTRAEFVLVTLDPDTDTTARLAAFKAEHGLPEASFHFLRGGREQTRALSRALGLRVAYDDGHIDHDVKIVVFDLNGRPTRAYSGWNFDENDVLR